MNNPQRMKHKTTYPTSAYDLYMNTQVIVRCDSVTSYQGGPGVVVLPDLAEVPVTLVLNQPYGLSIQNTSQRQLTEPQPHR